MPIIPVVAGNADNANAVLLQPDGRIVLAGQTGPNSGPSAFEFAIVRLNPDGTLDPSFSGDGKVVVQVGGTGSNSAFDAALQTDGKIVLVGQAYDPVAKTYDFAAVRLDAYGTLDTSFSGDGKTLIPVGSGNDFASGVALQADGKIILVGERSEGGVPVVRLNTDGSLDTSFSGDGKAVIPVGGGYGSGSSVAVQADGKIVVAGQGLATNGKVGFSIFRLDTDGSLDTSFSGDGQAVFSLGATNSFARSVVVQADGKIVLGGLCYVDNDFHTGFALIRLNPDGTLDTGFSDDGQIIFQVGAYSNNFAALALQQDGRIIAAGYGQDLITGANFYALARLNTDGTLDTTFSGDGKATRKVSGVIDYAYDVAVQSDGRIVAAGTSSGQGGYDFSLARLNADGTTDLTLPDTRQTGTGILFGTPGVDIITGLGGNDTIYGQDESDLLYGGSGDDEIDGGPGTDYLYGEDGNDLLLGGPAAGTPNQLWGGTGNDTASYWGTTGIVHADLTAQASYVDGVLVDQMNSIENITGWSGADTLLGDGNANVLKGGAGADYLNGKGGTDTLLGEDGDDVLVGGAAGGTPNQLLGGTGNDTASYEGTAGTVYADLTAQAGYVDGVLVDQMSSIENLSSGTGINTLVGDGGTNLLRGGNGADYLYGQGGNDILIGGAAPPGSANQLWGGTGIDAASYTGTAGTVYADLGALASWVDGALVDQMNSIENLIGGTGISTLVGDGGSNVLRGGAGIDYLYGQDGDDTLIGGGAPSGSTNQLWGGTGSDTASYAGATAIIYADLTAQAVYISSVLTDLTNSIENLVGGSANDVLAGDGGANALTGAGGADQLYGRGGADRFVYAGWSDSNLVTGYDAIADFASGTDGLDLTALHTSAAHIAILSDAVSTSLYVNQTPGVLNVDTDVAISFVGANAITMSDIDF